MVGYKNEVDVVAQKQNFVTQVAMQSNISLGNTAGTLTKPGSIAEYASNAAGNFGKIAEIGMHAAATMEANQPSSNQVGQSSGASLGKSILGGAALVAVGTMAPAVAGIAAGIGVAMAAKDAINFSIGHAAVNGAQGELTMAASAATFDKDNNMTSYTSACDNVTSDVKSGKPIMGQAAAPLRGQHNLDAIVGQVADKYDPEQIQRDVRSMLEKEQQKYGWAMNKLDMLGFKDPSITKDLGVDNTMTAAKLEAPRPKALNVGMGAPAAFGMG